MKCPFCNGNMVHGLLSGDGRSKVYWQKDNKKIGVMDMLCGKGRVDARYTLSKFYIDSEYCNKCRKLIISTDIQE